MRLFKILKLILKIKKFHIRLLTWWGIHYVGGVGTSSGSPSMVQHSRICVRAWVEKNVEYTHQTARCQLCGVDQEWRQHILNCLIQFWTVYVKQVCSRELCFSRPASTGIKGNLKRICRNHKSKKVKTKKHLKKIPSLWSSSPSTPLI